MRGLRGRGRARLLLGGGLGGGRPGGPARLPQLRLLVAVLLHELLLPLS